MTVASIKEKHLEFNPIKRKNSANKFRKKVKICVSLVFTDTNIFVNVYRYTYALFNSINYLTKNQKLELRGRIRVKITEDFADDANYTTKLRVSSAAGATRSKKNKKKKKSLLKKDKKNKKGKGRKNKWYIDTRITSIKTGKKRRVKPGKRVRTKKKSKQNRKPRVKYNASIIKLVSTNLIFSITLKKYSKKFYGTRYPDLSSAVPGLASFVARYLIEYLLPSTEISENNSNNFDKQNVLPEQFYNKNKEKEIEIETLRIRKLKEMGRKYRWVLECSDFGNNNLLKPNTSKRLSKSTEYRELFLQILTLYDIYFDQIIDKCSYAYNGCYTKKFRRRRKQKSNLFNTQLLGKL